MKQLRMRLGMSVLWVLVVLLGGFLNFGRAGDVASDQNFKGRVNFDTGCQWSIDGTKVTPTAAELNIMDGVTATAAQLNAAGATATALITETNRAQVAEAVISTNGATMINLNGANIANGHIALARLTNALSPTLYSGTVTNNPATTNVYVILHGSVVSVTAL